MDKFSRMLERMMVYFLSWILCVFIGMLPLAALAAKSDTIIRIGYDDSCPYSCLKAGEKGYFVEAVEEILKSNGFTTVTIKGSWARLKTMAQKGDLELVMPVTRFEAEQLGLDRNALFLGRIEGILFTHKTSLWRYENEASLKGQSMALIRGYSYPPVITNLMDNPNRKAHITTLSSGQGTELQVKMLASRRIDVVPADRNTFLFQARRLGLESIFRIAGEVPMEPLYTDLHIGISARDPELRARLRQQLDSGIERLQKTNWFDRAKAKYGIK